MTNDPLELYVARFQMSLTGMTLAIRQDISDCTSARKSTVLGLYYLAWGVRPHEAVRQPGFSLALREKLGDPRQALARPLRARACSRLSPHWIARASAAACRALARPAWLAARNASPRPLSASA